MDVIEYCQELENQNRYLLARQLFRAATSIGANVREAQNSESKSDFMHKMKVAIKESDETDYWLRLAKYSWKGTVVDALLESHTVISKILNKIISTTRIRNQ